MSTSYIKALRETLPKIDIVFDRFHVIKLVNKALDDVRKIVYNELNRGSRKSLKRSRFLLLRNQKDLSVKEAQRLEKIVDKYEILGIAHILKEDLRGIWNIRFKSVAREAFVNWALDVISLVCLSGETRLEPLHKFAVTLLGHLNGILNYWDHQITNGRAEGLNNKIKTMKRQVYGFRDMPYFKLRLYHLHAQKHRFAG
jgi:transposase